MQRTARVTVVAAVCAIAASLGLAGKIGMAQQSTPEQQLLQLERDWCTAQLKKDAALLGRILAEDFIGVTSRSSVSSLWGWRS